MKMGTISIHLLDPVPNNNLMTFEAIQIIADKIAKAQEFVSSEFWLWKGLTEDQALSPS